MMGGDEVLLAVPEKSSVINGNKLWLQIGVSGWVGDRGMRLEARKVA